MNQTGRKVVVVFGISGHDRSCPYGRNLVFVGADHDPPAPINPYPIIPRGRPNEFLCVLRVFVVQIVLKRLPCNITPNCLIALADGFTVEVGFLPCQ